MCGGDTGEEANRGWTVEVRVVQRGSERQVPHKKILANVVW